MSLTIAVSTVVSRVTYRLLLLGHTHKRLRTADIDLPSALSFRYYHRNRACSYFSPMLATYPTHHYHCTCRRVQDLKLYVMKFSSVCCHFLLLSLNTAISAILSHIMYVLFLMREIILRIHTQLQNKLNFCILLELYIQMINNRIS
jgi:hypothetical protein